MYRACSTPHPPPPTPGAVCAENHYTNTTSGLCIPCIGGGSNTGGNGGTTCSCAQAGVGYVGGGTTTYIPATGCPCAEGYAKGADLLCTLCAANYYKAADGTCTTCLGGGTTAAGNTATTCTCGGTAYTTGAYSSVTGCTCATGYKKLAANNNYICTGDERRPLHAPPTVNNASCQPGLACTRLRLGSDTRLTP
jgi:hypothetical protein